MTYCRIRITSTLSEARTHQTTTTSKQMSRFAVSQCPEFLRFFQLACDESGVILLHEVRHAEGCRRTICCCGRRVLLQSPHEHAHTVYVVTQQHFQLPARGVQRLGPLQVPVFSRVIRVRILLTHPTFLQHLRHSVSGRLYNGLYGITSILGGKAVDQNVALWVLAEQPCDLGQTKQRACTWGVDRYAQ